MRCSLLTPVCAGAASQFGGVLDMVTDRFCTAGLLVVLGRLYEHMWLPFLFLMFLDVVSHWCKMYRWVQGRVQR